MQPAESKDIQQLASLYDSSCKQPPKQRLKRPAGDERIIINVSGKRFATCRKFLLQFPLTRLGRMASLLRPDGSCVAFRAAGRCRRPCTSATSYEFSFCTDASIFHNILHFYHSGELHFCKQCCPSHVRRELQFWQIPECHISSCCLQWYLQGKDNDSYLQKMESRFRRQGDFHLPNLCKTSFQYNLWKLLDDPTHSSLSMVWGIFYLAVALLSIFLKVVDGMEQFRVNNTLSDTSAAVANGSVGGESVSDVVRRLVQEEGTQRKIIYLMTSQPMSLLTALDRCCSVFFSVELVVRLGACPCKKRFFWSLVNVADCVCVAVYWLVFVLLNQLPLEFLVRNYALLLVLQCVLTLRFVRVLRFATKYDALRVLSLTIYYSWKEFLLLFTFVVSAMSVFGFLIYYADFMDESSHYPNVLVGMWWAVITMTTVGYGDLVPSSLLGRFVAICCTVAGLLLIALPIPVVANRFVQFYEFAQMKKSLKHYKLRAADAQAARPLHSGARQRTLCALLPQRFIARSLRLARPVPRQPVAPSANRPFARSNLASSQL